MKQRDPLIYGIIGVLIGGAFVWFSATNAVNNNNYGMMQMMGMRGGNQGMMISSTTIDAHFIEQMIPHHQMAVMMASMLKSSTNRDEMRKLADDIITAQTSEIDQMRQWYINWGY